MTDHALYLHIPFCRHRCAYCDFTTYAGQDALIPSYVDALCREIRLVGESAPEMLGVKTIFFGGGTPSLLSVAQFASIFESIRQNFDLRPDAEISLEANPGTLDPDYLHGLRSVGFNRLSLGVQSAHPDELRMLERIHSYADVVAATASARKAGFDNLNFDLIFGLPEQTLDRWQATVERVLGLRPEHLSLYALTLEHGTPFGRWAARGLLPLPDPDLAAEMYEWAGEFLAGRGYQQYEISNWAKSSTSRPSNLQPSFACKHNLQYWRNLPYLGFGAGAHGFADGARYSNVLRIRTYIDRLLKPSVPQPPFPASPAVVARKRVSSRQAMQETMMLGLRLTREGVSADTFQARFGRSVSDVFGKEIDALLALGLLEWAGTRLRLTPHARLLGNQVFVRFVG
ncbi:MAG: radical SAM family heme chaperone HemW [Chloroflexi bacterium]|nr:radical SAM family heme chaperone HemW [Chloroflexota bacterium]